MYGAICLPLYNISEPDCLIRRPRLLYILYHEAMRFICLSFTGHFKQYRCYVFSLYLLASVDILQYMYSQASEHTFKDTPLTAAMLGVDKHSRSELVTDRL